MSNEYPYASMRDSFDLSAYFVVGPEDCKGRPLTDVVDQALHGGATFIQLRAKDADAKDLTDMASRWTVCTSARPTWSRAKPVPCSATRPSWACRLRPKASFGSSTSCPTAASTTLAPVLCTSPPPSPRLPWAATTAPARRWTPPRSTPSALPANSRPRRQEARLRSARRNPHPRY